MLANTNLHVASMDKLIATLATATITTITTITLLDMALLDIAVFSGSIKGVVTGVCNLRLDSYSSIEEQIWRHFNDGH